MTFLDGSIAGISEVVSAFFWREEVEQVACLSPCVFHGSWRGVTHEVLELGEDLFDWIEIGTVGWQEDQMSPDPADCLSCCLSFVAAEIVQDHNVARGQCRDEHLLHIGREDVTIDRSINDPRCVDAVVTQRCDEGQRLPVPMGRHLRQALTSWAPASERCHIGLDPGLINEHEPSGINLALMRLPARSLAGNVRSLLLRRQDRFF